PHVAANRHPGPDRAAHHHPGPAGGGRAGGQPPLPEAARGGLTRGPREAEPLEVRDTAEGATLRVRVVPRAGREEIAGARGGALVVRLSVPPVEGQANRALIALLARAAGRPPSSVSL